jgi:hypothetical protein
MSYQHTIDAAFAFCLESRGEFATVININSDLDGSEPFSINFILHDGMHAKRKRREMPNYLIDDGERNCLPIMCRITAKSDRSYR